jgi:hypothetical protein
MTLVDSARLDELASLDFNFFNYKKRINPYFTGLRVNIP